VAELRAEVEKVKAMMEANIDKVIYRGERLDNLKDLSEDLFSPAVMIQVLKHIHVHAHIQIHTCTHAHAPVE